MARRLNTLLHEMKMKGQPLELKFNPAKVSSVSAVNGVGKTSVYDAVRYAITGRLPWLEELSLVPADSAIPFL